MLKNALTVIALVLVAAAGLLPFSGAPRVADADTALAAELPAPGGTVLVLRAQADPD